MSMENPISNDRIPDETVNHQAGGESPPFTEEKNLFEEHKGKLAIGVAATLGVMIFYNWLEKQLAKDDPESHARLQRLKAVVRAREAGLGQDEDESGVNNDGPETDDEIDGVIPSQVMNCKGPDGVSAAR